MEKLYEAVSALIDCDLGEATEGDVGDLALRLDAARRCAAISKELAAAIELALIDAMPEDDIEVATVGHVYRKTKHGTRVTITPEKARSDLAIAVSRRMGIDPYTGAIDDDRRQIARETVELVTKVVSVTGRSFTKAAKDLIDLDPSEYVASTKTHSIIITNEPEEA